MRLLILLLLFPLTAFAQVGYDGQCYADTDAGRKVWACSDPTAEAPPEPEPTPEPDFSDCQTYEAGYFCTTLRPSTGSYVEYDVYYLGTFRGWLYYPPDECPTLQSDVTLDPVCGASEPDPEPIPEPPPSQSAYRGVPDPSTALGYDVFADYSTAQTISGPQGQRQLICNGTATSPCLIDASAATFSALSLSGSHAILQGGTVNAPGTNGPFVAIRSCESCVIRDVEVVGPGTDQGHSSAVSLASNSAWIRGSIHGFGDNRATAREQDFHGIKVMTSSVWIWEAEIYDVSGDSVQCGDASRGICSNVYISGGSYHDNRENAVDIKDSRNVVVSGVTMYGFGGTSSDPGSAGVVHDDAYDSKWYDNVIRDANIGIVSSGRSGHVITGNSIEAHRTGLELRNTTDLTVSDNSIAAPTCVDAQGGLSGTIQSGCN